MTSYNKGALHICWTEPLHEVFRKPVGVKWCFACRKRTEFVHVVMSPVELSYYGPNHQIECTACKTVDGDCFPGTSRDWE